jgi:heat-inducible transcriptional repressor
MSTRQDKLFKIIIEEYIKTARPVGSKILVEKYKLGLSSATVRSEMNKLEKRGFLVHPHTSAGRVPI